MIIYFRKIILLIFFISILFLSFSCSTNKQEVYQLKNGLIYKYGKDKPYTGKVTGKVKDKIIEYDVADGKKNGRFILKYSNGNIEIDGEIQENKNDGIWKYYYTDGTLESEGKFVNDLPEGQWLWYYNDGTIKEEGVFNKGNREGEWRNYNQQGRLELQKSFKNNLLIDSVNSMLK